MFSLTSWAVCREHTHWNLKLGNRGPVLAQPHVAWPCSMLPLDVNAAVCGALCPERLGPSLPWYIRRLRIRFGNELGGRNVTFALRLLQSICLSLVIACLLQVVPVAEAAMSALYPSLEDMKVDQTLQAQANAAARALAGVAAKSEPATAPPVLYPNLTELGDYMGLSLSSEEVQKDLALLPASGNAGALGPSSQGVLVAPLTGNNLGLRRAEIRPGLRELHLCKDERGKTGIQLKSIDQGVFVQLVKANSPASLVGLRFGDQVLQIDGKDCAGWSTDKANRALKKAAPEKIVVIVRDRPFQRTVTMHKDSTGHVGFVIKKGKIVSLTKGSSAARNGLLINHYLCELNGQNVIGLKDKQILDILATAGNAITITIIPTVIYEHMVKRLSPGKIKSSMDHSLPDA
ncbi:syntenin-2 [Pangshura tecta]